MNTPSMKLTRLTLPFASPLMEPHTANLPAGLPEPPEDGLEAMGFDPPMPRGSHNGYFSSRVGADYWVEQLPKTLRVGGSCLDVYVLRRPPVAKPEPTTETVPFDSIADFGDVFPVWVHLGLPLPSMITGFHKGADSEFCVELLGDLTAVKELAKGSRWSTSPLTPWEDCKPFTKEVPA